MELAGRHYVLTADHVWNQTKDRQKDWKELVIAVVSDSKPLSIPVDRIVERRLGGPPYTEWGPDLALLEIPLTW